MQWDFHRGLVALDEGRQILAEYSKYCSGSGAPRLGDEFFRWVFQTQYSSCKLVKITPNSERGFEEFPDEESLEGFDRQDRKFVAVAVASRDESVVVNAVDSDYRNFAGALAGAGVRVKELCVHCLSTEG